MNTKIAAFQSWLNTAGLKPQLRMDGVPGPATRQGVFDAFRNRAAPAVTGDDIRALALRLGCTERQIKAVAKVESGGAGWDEAGLLRCLFERHYAWKRIRIASPWADLANAFLSHPTAGGYTIDADRDGICDSWEKLADLALSTGDPKRAFECASFGKFQIMGAWAEKLGYRSSLDFVWKLSRDEAAHYDAFARYIETFGLTRALRQVSGATADCTAFAVGYNGKGQRGYDAKIAAAYRGLAG